MPSTNGPRLAQTLTRSVVLSGLAWASMVTGCVIEPPDLTGLQAFSNSTAPALRDRDGDVDTTRLIARFRARGGGGVFVQLTEEASLEALQVLRNAGLRPPPE